MLDRQGCFALGGVGSFQSAQHYNSGAVVSFTCAITPSHILTQLDMSSCAVVASTGQSRVAIAMRMHAHDRDCETAITECKLPPMRTPAYHPLNAPPLSPYYLPNRPLGRLEGAAVRNRRWYPQFLQF